MRIVKGRGGQNGTSIIDGDGEGKKINIGSKGVVFLFLRSGNGPSRVNSQVLQKPIWVVLVHLLLLWVCHGLIDYRVHHEGIFMCCDEQPNNDGVFCVSSSTEFGSLLQMAEMLRIKFKWKNGVKRDIPVVPAPLVVLGSGV
ncbi:hypothetical protein SO802_011668 [Lithocarpus litseifolius]|uniref:Uncharacterized protein n=1 Tax=Lithocarpus litseifolius TaxID=425828 RepID=A0AAW2D1A8_9ROSI